MPVKERVLRNEYNLSQLATYIGIDRKTLRIYLNILRDTNSRGFFLLDEKNVKPWTKCFRDTKTRAIYSDYHRWIVEKALEKCRCRPLDKVKAITELWASGEIDFYNYQTCMQNTFWTLKDFQDQLSFPRFLIS